VPLVIERGAHDDNVDVVQLIQIAVDKVTAPVALRFHRHDQGQPFQHPAPLHAVESAARKFAGRHSLAGASKECG